MPSDAVAAAAVGGVPGDPLPVRHVCTVLAAPPPCGPWAVGGPYGRCCRWWPGMIDMIAVVAVAVVPAPTVGYVP